MQLQHNKLQYPLTPTILIQHPSLFPNQNKTSLVPTPPPFSPPPNKLLNDKQMQKIVKEMRFREKMQLVNSKKQKYKRSTNNCHKKYIGILKNLMFLKMSNQIKDYILSQYQQYRNSRVYYFINLCYLKWCLDIPEIAWVFQHFCQEVQNKIARYRLEISMTNNENFINFRKDEIVQMEYAIHSINHFFRGATEQSIRVLYQKNKYIIIKKNQYTRTLDIVFKIDSGLEREYAHIHMPTKLSQLDLQSLYHFSGNSRPSLTLLKQSQNDFMKQSYRQSISQKQKQKSINQQSQQEIRHKQDKMCVKIQEQQPEVEQQYPLIGLQNSYQLMSQIKWHSWIIQKQKILEFIMRTRQQKVNKISKEDYSLH